MIMCLTSLPDILSTFLLKWMNELLYTRSLLFPAARENEMLISKVRQSIKRWKFHLFQSLGLCCVFSCLCLAATEARTSCALHLNQAL